MAVTRLSLTNFRNHAEAVIRPGAGFVVLTGENGAGKTNILEAVSLLTPGRGLRGATLGEMARKAGPGGFGSAPIWRQASRLGRAPCPQRPNDGRCGSTARRRAHRPSANGWRCCG